MTEAENETKGDSEMHSASDSTASDSSGSSDPAVSDSSASSSSQTPAQSGSQAPTLGKGREDRASWLEGCSKTFEYLTEVSKDKTLHFRQSDKITTRLLVASLIGSLIFAAFPFFEMKTLAACCYLLADFMLLAAIVVFVVSRFGIIRAMAPRHALVSWHLMIGTGLLFLVIGFNLVAFIVLIMLRDKLQAYIGG